MQTISDTPTYRENVNGKDKRLFRIASCDIETTLRGAIPSCFFSFRRFVLPIALVATTGLLSVLHAQERPSDTEARAFVDKLLPRMTLKEKIEQMEQAAGQYITSERAK